MNAIIETATNTLLIGCNNSTIPNSIQDIGDYAFQNCKDLKTIIIPETVKQIGHSAFQGCGLSKIDIPNSVTLILSEAFSGCESLNSITLPNSIPTITHLTFSGCISLSSIEIPKSVTNIESFAFQNCKGFKTIIIPNNVTTIGSYAFENCQSLSSIVLSINIKEIRNGAFNTGCPLSDVYCLSMEVPNGANFYLPYGNNSTLHVPAGSIEKYEKASPWNKFGNIVALTKEELAIYGDDIPEIELSNSIEGIYMTQPDSYCLNNGDKQTYGNSYEIIIVDNGDGSYYVDDLLGGWYSQRVGLGPNYFMTGNVEITTNGFVSLKDSYVKGWGNSLVGLTGSYNSEKKTFALEEDYVEGMKFYQNWVKVGDIFTVDGITYVMNGKNTVSVRIGKEPYSGDIKIPENVSYNGETYTVTSLGTAFRGCENLKSVIIPKTVTSIDDAFIRCTGLTSVTIPEGIASISGAFYECTSLKTVIIPNSVTTLDNSEFWGCTSLETVDIPNSVTTIGVWAFQGCTSLTSITVPGSVVSIGRKAFMNCVNLADLTLSDGLLTIGNDAFSYCNGLRKLIIPRSVLRIGNYAFTMCEDIESIRVDNENVKYDSRGNCDAIIETYTNRLILGCKNTVIPQDVTAIGECAFSNVDFKSFEITNGVSSIERCAFSSCIEMQSIITPPTLKKIERYAFEICTGLKDFYNYADSYPETHLEAFSGTPIENATLHAPANLIDTYKSTAPWSGFGKIVALTDNDPQPTNVKTLKAEETASPVATYSIDGRRLSQLQRGLNIIRMSDGTTKKVCKR